MGFFQSRNPLRRPPIPAGHVRILHKSFHGTCNTPSNIYFDAHGAARCADPETVPLELYEVTLKLGNETRIVSLNGYSGKVTVQ